MKFFDKWKVLQVKSSTEAFTFSAQVKAFVVPGSRMSMLYKPSYNPRNAKRCSEQTSGKQRPGLPHLEALEGHQPIPKKPSSEAKYLHTLSTYLHVFTRAPSCTLTSYFVNSSSRDKWNWDEHCRMAGCRITMVVETSTRWNERQGEIKFLCLQLCCCLPRKTIVSLLQLLYFFVNFRSFPFLFLLFLCPGREEARSSTRVQFGIEGDLCSHPKIPWREKSSPSPICNSKTIWATFSLVTFYHGTVTSTHAIACRVCLALSGVVWRCLALFRFFVVLFPGCLQTRGRGFVVSKRADGPLSFNGFSGLSLSELKVMCSAVGSESAGREWEDDQGEATQYEVPRQNNSLTIRITT